MSYEYVPAYRARVVKTADTSERKYTVVLDGHRIEVSKADFVEQNQKLSALYKITKNARKRGEIAHRLYQLDLPLFKEWDLFQKDSREDYKQTAFLYTVMALEKFDPAKGSFIYWLRHFIKSARDNVREYHKKDNLNIPYDEAHDEGGEEPQHDSILEMDRLKAMMSPERWAMIEKKVFYGMNDSEIAASMGIHRHTAKKKIDDAVESLRSGMIMRHREEADPFLNDGSEWLTRRQLAARLGIKYYAVGYMLRKNIPYHICKNIIDKRDYSPIGGGRIRYKETQEGGLIYPRILPRPNKLILKPESDTVEDEDGQEAQA